MFHEFLKISPLRIIQIIKRNRNPRNVSFRSIISLLTVSLRGRADDPSIKYLRIRLWGKHIGTNTCKRMIKSEFKIGDKNLFLNE